MAALDGPQRLLVVAAVAGEADLAGLLGLKQCLDHLSTLEVREFAGVQLHDIDVVGLKTLQAAIDAGLDGAAVPVAPLEAVPGVAALGGEHELVPSAGHCPADELFAVAVAGGGVEEVDAAVEGGVQDGGYCVDAFLGEFVIADFRQAHAEAGDFESGVSERCFFQDAAPRVVSLEKGRREVCASIFNASTGPRRRQSFLGRGGWGLVNPAVPSSGVGSLTLPAGQGPGVLSNMEVSQP